MADLAALLQPVTGAVTSGVLILLGLFVAPGDPMTVVPALLILGWMLALPASYPIAAAIVARDEKLRAERRAAFRR